MLLSLQCIVLLYLVYSICFYMMDQSTSTFLYILQGVVLVGTQLQDCGECRDQTLCTSCYSNVILQLAVTLLCYTSTDLQTLQATRYSRYCLQAPYYMYMYDIYNHIMLLYKRTPLYYIIHHLDINLTSFHVHVVCTFLLHICKLVCI